MATSLRCPECQATLGKDTENTVDAYCGECGAKFYNSYGYIQDRKHYEEVKLLYPNKKLPKPDNE